MPPLNAHHFIGLALGGAVLPVYFLLTDVSFRPATRGGEFWVVVAVLWALGVAIAYASLIWARRRRAEWAARNARRADDRGPGSA